MLIWTAKVKEFIHLYKKNRRGYFPAYWHLPINNALIVFQTFLRLNPTDTVLLLYELNLV